MWFQRLLQEAPLDCADLSEVSNWAFSAQDSEDKAAYGALMYNVLQPNRNISSTLSSSLLLF